jgi:hypothetical protein
MVFFHFLNLNQSRSKTNSLKININIPTTITSNLSVVLHCETIN